MIKRGIAPNVVTLNMIVDGCCREGDIVLAFELVKNFSEIFGSWIEPNCVTYNSLINGLCKAGDAAVGERVLREDMRKWGIKPNLRTYATLVDGFLKQRKMDEALRLFNEMLDMGFCPNSTVYNSLINCFLKQGYVEYAWFLLSSMIEARAFPDHITYSILVEGCLRNGFVKEAFQCHQMMRDEALIRDVVSHNILINYLCKHGKIKEAKLLLANMITSGFFPDSITYTTLIDGCCRECGVDDALQIYEGMVKYNQKPNLVTYNTIINGLCRENSIDVARLVMEEMVRAGLDADVFTYNTLINSYCRKENFDGAFCLYFQMRRLGIMETESTYNTLLNFLCKSGFIELAKDFLMEMLDRGKWKVRLMDERHALIQLTVAEDYTRIFSKKYLSIAGKSIKLLKWSPDFDPIREPPTVPVWFNLLGLKLHFFHHQVFYSIGAILGDPMTLDLPTFNLTRPSVARILVERDITLPDVTQVWLSTTYNGYWQQIVMENRLPCCSHCKMFGHTIDKCHKFHPNLKSKDQVNKDGSNPTILDIFVPFGEKAITGQVLDISLKISHPPSLPRRSKPILCPTSQFLMKNIILQVHIQKCLYHSLLLKKTHMPRHTRVLL